MKIPLNEFEQLIDEKILKRGLSYFKNGAISDFSEISAGEYEAAILGTEEYRVQLKIKNNIVTEYNCNCPYDYGPVCKHTVAAIFYLLQDELLLNQSVPVKSKKRTKSVNQQIKELLAIISHQELIDFVSESCKNDRKFRNYFLTSFGHLSQNQSKEFYQKQIRSILKTATGRNGWISWSEMSFVFNSTHPILDNAEQYFLKENYESVFFISTALLEEMTDALQYADDSNGDIGYYINSAIDLLKRLSKEKLPQSLKKDFMEYCITAFNNRLFEGWDWHLDMLRIASNLAVDEYEADIVLDILKTVKGDFNQSYAELYILELLEKFKDAKETANFIEKHISNSKIRELEIKKAFENKNFERAVKLAKDGIKHDEKDKPGLVKDWYDWLLKIALEQKDTPNIIKYARYRLIDNFRGTLDYYQILKNNIEPEEWSSFLEELIQEIASKKSWTSQAHIRQIFIKEKWWDRLFSLLKQNLSLRAIEDDEPYLAKNYSIELVELYQKEIVDFLERNVGRNHYQTACKYIRRMKKLGGNEQAEGLIESLRRIYPQRRALLDELNKV